MLDTKQAIPTTEDHDLAEPDLTMEMAISPKRRRVEGFHGQREAMDSFPPAQPAYKAPQTPASRQPNAVPRFTHAPSSIASTLNEAATQHRPPFLRLSAAPSEPSEPLPEAFSPHRRGHKFVPGGMAATLQQWVIKTGQSTRGPAYLRRDDYAMKVRVEQVEGDGPYLVQAKTSDGEGVWVLLAGSAISQGRREPDVTAGSVVGVRAPTWAVQVEGKEWTVGVVWKVLS
ncbi:hypothetical protein LTR53_011042 [Teratosphaeriaceae sp. CCFEE 6253]|nr:hypothetical protein LTR53_011042 [Teratosphaeriaceae sp. CCFEE 6253]